MKKRTIWLSTPTTTTTGVVYRTITHNKITQFNTILIPIRSIWMVGWLIGCIAIHYIYFLPFSQRLLSARSTLLKWHLPLLRGRMYPASMIVCLFAFWIIIITETEPSLGIFLYSVNFIFLVFLFILKGKWEGIQWTIN